MIKINVPGPAVPLQRARFGRNGVYTPTKSRNYKALVTMMAAQVMQGAKPIAAPVSLSVEIVLAVPLSWPGWKRRLALSGQIAPTTKFDLSNVIKGIEDALNGVVWDDDRFVVTYGAVSKSYGEKPEVNITVAPVEMWPANVTKKEITA